MTKTGKDPQYGGASFDLRNRIERAIWNVTWKFFASWTPSRWWRWRIFLLRVFGAKTSAHCDVKGTAKIWLPRNLELGEYAQIADRVNFYNQARVILGSRALVSQDATICAGTHDIDSIRFPLIAKPIVIEDNAWVAAESFVGPGAHLGEGAVLGARSVCFGRLDAWTVYTGNPCKPIRRRDRLV